MSDKFGVVSTKYGDIFATNRRGLYYSFDGGSHFIDTANGRDLDYFIDRLAVVDWNREPIAGIDISIEMITSSKTSDSDTTLTIYIDPERIAELRQRFVDGVSPLHSFKYLAQREKEFVQALSESEEL